MPVLTNKREGDIFLSTADSYWGLTVNKILESNYLSVKNIKKKKGKKDFWGSRS